MSWHPDRFIDDELQMNVCVSWFSMSVQFIWNVMSFPICIGDEGEESEDIWLIVGIAFGVWSIVIVGRRAVFRV